MLHIKDGEGKERNKTEGPLNGKKKYMNEVGSSSYMQYMYMGELSIEIDYVLYVGQNNERKGELVSCVHLILYRGENKVFGRFYIEPSFNFILIYRYHRLLAHTHTHTMRTRTRTKLAHMPLQW